MTEDRKKNQCIAQYYHRFQHTDHLIHLYKQLNLSVRGTHVTCDSLNRSVSTGVMLLLDTYRQHTK